jgi:hypothetical protein
LGKEFLDRAPETILYSGFKLGVQGQLPVNIGRQYVFDLTRELKPL